VRWTAAVAAVGLVAIVLTAALVAFVTQAASPDYTHLYWSLLPFAAVHTILVVAYAVWVHHWSRWIAVSFGTLALASFSEMTLRVCGWLNWGP
jgi:hypothetical protein